MEKALDFLQKIAKMSRTNLQSSDILWGKPNWLGIGRKFGRSSAEPRVRSITILEYLLIDTYIFWLHWRDINFDNLHLFFFKGGIFSHVKCRDIPKYYILTYVSRYVHLMSNAALNDFVMNVFFCLLWFAYVSKSPLGR